MKNVLYDMALGIGTFSRGDEYTIFTFEPRDAYIEPSGAYQGHYRFGVPICYESVFPARVRRFVEKGVDFMVVITNDAWFGKTTAPFQHARIAVFRAIENRVSIARCANTGISCLIDATGRVTESTGIFHQAVLSGRVGLRNRDTFYTQYGDRFAQVISAITFIGLLCALFGPKKE
jgi:apolipoprotein N-acyltransferase